MFKKFIVATVMIIFLTCTLNGCTFPGTGSTNKEAGKVTSHKGATTLEGLDKNVIHKKANNQASQEDEFATEMKHWKYGTKKSTPANTTANPSSRPTTALTPAEGSNGDWSQSVSIELLSAEDMDSIINILVTQGYLTQKTRNESEFRQALAKFQSDNSLAATGDLNNETLEVLNRYRKKTGSNN